MLTIKEINKKYPGTWAERSAYDGYRVLTDICGNIVIYAQINDNDDRLYAIAIDGTEENINNFLKILANHTKK